jgi:hypothetical protein
VKKIFKIAGSIAALIISITLLLPHFFEQTCQLDKKDKAEKLLTSKIRQRKSIESLNSTTVVLHLETIITSGTKKKTELHG